MQGSSCSLAHPTPCPNKQLRSLLTSPELPYLPYTWEQGSAAHICTYSPMQARPASQKLTEHCGGGHECQCFSARCREVCPCHADRRRSLKTGCPSHRFTWRTMEPGTEPGSPLLVAGTKAITPENLTGRTGMGVAKGIPVLQFQLKAMYRRALPISRLHQRGQCLCFRLLALQLLPDTAVRQG